MRRADNHLIRIAAVGAILLVACSGSPPEARSRLTVAAASNLIGVFDEIAAAFRKETGLQVVFSFGSTAQLAQQIENGAPFDLFAAADTQHVDDLVKKDRILGETRAIYTTGQLALWVPQGSLGIRDLQDLTDARVRFIAIAQPSFAPYGEAAVQALKQVGLWDRLLPKVVYANNINAARQYAASGSADAAFTAYSLVLRETGTVIKVDPRLHQPLNQALGVVSSSPRVTDARRFASFVLGRAGRSILEKNGYLVD